MGKLILEADSFVIAAAVGWTQSGDSSFTFHITPPGELPFLDVRHVEERAFQAVVFFPKDVPVDPDYESGMRYMLGEVDTWFDIQCGRYNAGDCAPYDFVKEGGDYSVKLLIGVPPLISWTE